MGSEVPNLLEPDAASTLVISLDLDIGVPVDRHSLVREGLNGLLEFDASSDEPSVWIPRTPGLLETGMPDPRPRRAEVAALLRRLETAERGDT